MKSAFITGANGGLNYGFAEYLVSQEFLVFAGIHGGGMSKSGKSS